MLSAATVVARAASAGALEASAFPNSEHRVIEAVPSSLAGWESYYVILGTSAAALTGLQFVVMALAADVSNRASEDQISAFGTPSIVHFCVALLISAVMSAPWRAVQSAALVIGVTGLAGLLYVAIVIVRTRRQRGYTPVFEDWLWHAALPVVAYAALAGGGIGMPRYEHEALFAAGAVALLLVFIGIHNAWDTVTYLVVTRAERETERAASETRSTASEDASEDARAERESERVASAGGEPSEPPAG